MIQSDALNCNESRDCFAKANGKCKILRIIPNSGEYQDGECPFAKENINDLPYTLPKPVVTIPKKPKVIPSDRVRPEIKL